MSPETPRQARQIFFDQNLAPKASEHGSQHRRTDQDDKNHGGGFCGFDHDAVQYIPDLVGAPQTDSDRDAQSHHRKGCDGHRDNFRRLRNGSNVDLNRLEGNDQHRDRHHRQNRREIGAPFSGRQAIAAHD